MAGQKRAKILSYLSSSRGQNLNVCHFSLACSGRKRSMSQLKTAQFELKQTWEGAKASIKRFSPELIQYQKAKGTTRYDKVSATKLHRSSGCDGGKMKLYQKIDLK